MEKKEKDGLIAFDYKSESAKATYDKIIVKADVITDGDKAKGIFKFLYNGEELPPFLRQFLAVVKEFKYSLSFVPVRDHVRFYDNFVVSCLCAFALVLERDKPVFFFLFHFSSPFIIL